jgi:hypothetical protein
MNRSHQRGIALVITLIMLSVVTITAVAFLAVTRQDRASVGAAVEQLDARNAAESALQRAQAEVVARIRAATNRQNFDLMVSTNWTTRLLNVAQLDALAAGAIDPTDPLALASLTNATTYFQADGRPVFNLSNPTDLQRQRASLMNLYYDARPPVFVPVGRSPLLAPEFRFYLDLNRNGVYDTNGPQLMMARGGQFLRLTNDLVGDPEWIGIREHPGLPHSGTNRFIARMAFVVLPAGKTLDLNFNHNEVKFRRPDPAQSGFSRNQGVGSWEVNLAAFLADLNTNIWAPRAGANYIYQYNTFPGAASTGVAFRDAGLLLAARRGSYVNTTAPGYYGNSTPFPNDRYDGYANGPIPATLAEFLRPQLLTDSDAVGLPWAGADNNRQWTDMTALLDGSLGQGLDQRLNGRRDFVGGVLDSTYDRNTFYRLLGSLGTDTGDARFESGTNMAGIFYRRAKLNLNYANQTNPNLDVETSADVNNFRDWAPLPWFTNAVHRILLTEFTNGLPDASLLASPRTFHLGHGLAVFGTNVIRGVTNIHRWDARVHRLLQVAANLYDATHYQSAARPGSPRGDIPTTFRPILYRQVTNGQTLVRLAGFAEVVNAGVVSRPWLDLDDPVQLNRLPETPVAADILAKGQDFNCVGIPWIVGAKKGLPNFQEAFWQSRLQVTRRLRVLKAAADAALTRTNARPWEDGRFQTQVQHRFDVFNSMGMEAWNSYETLSNSAPVRLIATNAFTFSLTDEAGRVQVIQTNGVASIPGTVIAAGKWRPGEYLVPLNTMFASSFIYDQVRRAVFPVALADAGYVAAEAPLPRLTLAYTNRLTYMLVDQASGRVLDFVNLKSVLFETNVLRLLGEASSGGGASLSMQDFWRTNRYGAGTTVTLGVGQQLDASLGATANGGAFNLPPDLWRNAIGGQPGIDQIEFEKDGMHYFLYRRPRTPGMRLTPQLVARFGGRSVQAGFTPSPSILITDRRQANDPLVHYTREDLAPGTTIFTSPEGYVEVPLDNGGRFRPGPRANIGAEASYFTNHLGNQPKVVSAYAPWGVNPRLGTSVDVGLTDANSTAFDVAFKDPLIRRSDDWDFPTNKFPGLGWMGRVHRGTPWQTLYLKGLRPELGTQSANDRYLGRKSWIAWAGHRDTRPEADWALLDLFTTAANDNAAKGLLSVNQTNLAPWSAIFSGVPVLTNDVGANVARRFIEPASPQMTALHQGIQEARSLQPGGRFRTLGHVLASGSLSASKLTNANNQVVLRYSPFLRPFDPYTNIVQVRDEVVEMLPQQTLSLLRTEEPRVVIYAYGQALRPAANSIVTRPGIFFGLCTNYAVAGEFATRTVVRFDGSPLLGPLRPIVEDHRILTPEN